MSMGHPSINLREDEEVDNALSVLLQQGYPRVCTLSGGFFALHEYIRRVNQTEWLIDHTPDACAVCKHYLFSDTLQKAVEASSEMASKTGMAEIGGLLGSGEGEGGFCEGKGGSAEDVGGAEGEVEEAELVLLEGAEMDEGPRRGYSERDGEAC